MALTKALEKLDDVDVAASVLEVVQEVSAAKKEDTPPPGSVPSAVLLTHTHTNIHIHVPTRSHIRTHTPIDTRMYTFIHAYSNAYTSANILACRHADMQTETESRAYING